MSSQSSTSSLESLNESYTTKYGLEPYEPRYFEQNFFLLRHSSEICSDDNSVNNSDEELNNVLEIQTGVYVVIAARWKHQQKVFVVVKC